jgi:hypothetical protein
LLVDKRYMFASLPCFHMLLLHLFANFVCGRRSSRTRSRCLPISASALSAACPNRNALSCKGNRGLWPFSCQYPFNLIQFRPLAVSVAQEGPCAVTCGCAHWDLCPRTPELISSCGLWFSKTFHTVCSSWHMTHTTPG